jgi:hypothetical protein
VEAEPPVTFLFVTNETFETLELKKHKKIAAALVLVVLWIVCYGVASNARGTQGGGGGSNSEVRVALAFPTTDCKATQGISFTIVNEASVVIGSAPSSAIKRRMDGICRLEAFIDVDSAKQYQLMVSGNGIVNDSDFPFVSKADLEANGWTLPAS